MPVDPWLIRNRLPSSPRGDERTSLIRRVSALRPLTGTASIENVFKEQAHPCTAAVEA